MRRLMTLLAFMALSLVTHQALANPCPPGNPPTNCGPPAGTPILDLAGTPIPHAYTQYTVNFVATDSTTNLSFALRDDPAFLLLDDIVVADLTGGTPVAVTNPGFESGVLLGPPVGWIFLNQFGAASSGFVDGTMPHSGTQEYADGSVQGYDGITQALATVAGHTYQLTFWLTETSDQTTFQQLSTNGNTTGIGGNGIDVLVFAGAVPTIPEPTSLALLGVALGGLLMTRRRTA